jgi:uncharacterized membrane protein YhhN
MDRVANGPRVNRLGLYLFAGALIADLIFIATGASGMRLLSKSLLAPALMVYFAANAPQLWAAPQRWLLPALGCCWIGDVLLLFEDRSPLFFILGLSSFLVGHLFYCLFFTGIWKKAKLRLNVLVALGVTAYYVALLLLLWPGLGPMKAPVAVYGAVISAMLLLALHMARLRRKQVGSLLVAGALLFVLSDSVLAINRFLKPLPFAGIAIMLTYGLAQVLLTQGALGYTAVNYRQPEKAIAEV